MKTNRQTGFTLLEILVALAVFAILATITSTAMYHAFTTRTRVTTQADHMNELQLAISLIQQDTLQIVDRSVRGNNLHQFPPFTGLSHYVEFTRGGFVNPENQSQNSSLKRIAFRCQDDKLIRRSRDMIDSPNRSHYQDKVLLTHLKKCHLSYLAHNRQQLTEWQAYALKQNQNNESLPAAIQLNITMGNQGNSSLLFIIPEARHAV
jgi:general secretion pathway protein J